MVQGHIKCKYLASKGISRISFPLKMNKRDSGGRLDMSAVRKAHSVSARMSDDNQSAMDYTATWVNTMRPPEWPQLIGQIRQGFAKSAPALSIKSKSSRSARARSLIEIELKQMKER